MLRYMLCSLAAWALLVGPAAAQTYYDYDLVIYGGTSGGLTAAIQAARMGKSVAVIEPSLHLGGMTTGGLSATDTGNTAAIAGLAREFYTRVGAAYGYAAGTPEWNFEPKVAENVLNTWMTQSGVDVIKGQRLNLASGVAKQDNRIQSIAMESGQIYRGAMFIDATYEGDLLAKAGVSYTVGREANSQYGELYNGVQVGRATKHQFSGTYPVDPYVVPGNPASGRLPGIEATPSGPDGSADHRLQAYNYRLTVTKAANRLPWTAPVNYDPNRYELLKRQIQAANVTSLGSLLSIRAIKGGKYDVNNNGPVSTDYIGGNYAYPNADYATRDQIVADHRSYQQGLLYFLATDPNVPQTLRDQMNSYGLAADEFTDNGGWSHSLYVREARRMVGPYVMTDQNVMGQVTASDPVALGSYTLDSHNTDRYVDAAGHVRNEGDVQITTPKPYGISYRSLIPNESEAGNLLVTSAISATHSAYGSIRMEPVFMELGQAAGTAAVLALQSNLTVQQLSYATLRTQLIADGALLNWPANVGQPLLAHEDFNDFAPLPVADLKAKGGGANWSNAWDGTGTQKVVAGNLTTAVGGYAIVPLGSGEAGKMQGTYNAPRQNLRTIQSALDGTVWFSVLVQNPDATAVAGLALNPTNNADPAATPSDLHEDYVELRGDKLSVMVDGAATNDIKTLAIGATHLLLGRLDIDAAGNDVLSVWADPSDLAHLGLPDFQAAGGDWLDSLTKVGIRSYNPAGPAFSANGGYVDALRLSNRGELAFSDVTGVTPVPEPSTLLLLGVAAGMLGVVLRRKVAGTRRVR